MVSENVVPPQSTEGGVGCPFLLGVVAWSADLRKVCWPTASPGTRTRNDLCRTRLECGHDEPLLAADQPEGFMEREGLQNLFLQTRRHTPTPW